MIGLSPYLPLLFTILGWWVVSRQQDKRERRKEVRDLIRLLEVRVDRVLELNVEYRALDGNDSKCPTLELKILQNLDSIRAIKKRLEAAGLPTDLTRETVKFRQAVTGGDFQSKSRAADQSGSQTAIIAAATGFDLISKIDTAYFDTFKVKLS